MSFLAGALVALGLGWAGNHLIWRVFHGRGTAWLVPLWEEGVKTGIGALAGQMVLVHGLFGLGEAVHETCRGEWTAASLALTSHVLFGLLATLAWRATGSFTAGWLAAAGLHLAWNRLVLHFSKR